MKVTGNRPAFSPPAPSPARRPWPARPRAGGRYDEKLSDSAKKYLQAYAKGVNAYLKGKDGADLSLEYAAL
ncbi:penicillin acylase family protein, partial [Streptomyces griseoincarnatus]